MNASTQEVLDQIRYIAWHDIHVADEQVGSISVELPARDDVLNHVGTVHAGALFTLAETAAGVAADRVAQTLDGIILLGEATVKYTRRADGKLLANAEVTEQVREDARQAFAQHNRAPLPVGVIVYDADEEPVLEGVFHYALRRSKS